MKVFYSWQSDSPNQVNRAFIKSAAKMAIEELNSSQDFDEAERAVTLDQDTQGVLGSPPIADTIFEKIASADIILADVTVSGQTAAGKKLINSNVAIELGYAIGCHGDGVLLKVMNTHYGSPNELPFDLQHRRWPVQYCLPPDSGLNDRKAAKEQLADQLLKIFKVYSKRAGQTLGDDHVPHPSVDGVGMFWSSDQVLIPKDDRWRTPEYKFSTSSPALYVRIWPSTQINEVASSLQREVAKNFGAKLSGVGGGSLGIGRNRWGTVVYAPIADPPGLYAFSQIFKNGEIWGVFSGMLAPYKNQDLDKKCIPSKSYEEQLKVALETYLDIGWESFGYPDLVHFEAGVANSDGYYMGMGSNYMDPLWGPIHDDNVVVRGQVNRQDDDSSKKALLAIFEGIFDAVGRDRPNNFNGFGGA